MQCSDFVHSRKWPATFTTQNLLNILNPNMERDSHDAVNPGIIVRICHQLICIYTNVYSLPNIVCCFWFRFVCRKDLRWPMEHQSLSETGSAPLSSPPPPSMFIYFCFCWRSVNLHKINGEHHIIRMQRNLTNSHQFRSQENYFILFYFFFRRQHLAPFGTCSVTKQKKE